MASGHGEIGPLDTGPRRLEPRQQIDERLVVAAIDRHDFRIGRRMRGRLQIADGRAVSKVDDQVQPIRGHHCGTRGSEKIREIEKVREVRDDERVQALSADPVAQLGMPDG